MGDPKIAVPSTYEDINVVRLYHSEADLAKEQIDDAPLSENEGDTSKEILTDGDPSPVMKNPINTAPSSTQEVGIEDKQKAVSPISGDRRNNTPSTNEGSPEPNTIRLNLYRAAVEGKWEDAVKIFEADESGYTLTMSLNNTGMTPLLVAANCGNSDFVMNLVEILDEEDLDMTDQLGRNVLHHAALACGTKAAQAIISKRDRLVSEKEANGYTPLFYAARWRHPSKSKRMLKLLYQRPNPSKVFQDPEKDKVCNLIVAIVASEAHDIALDVFENNPGLSLASNSKRWNILHILATQPSAFESKTSTWKTQLYKCLNIVSEEDQKHRNAMNLVDFICGQLKTKSDEEIMDYFTPNKFTAVLNLATQNGTFQLVEKCLKTFPDLIWYSSGAATKKLLIHVAVKYRQDEIFKCITDLIGENPGVYAGTVDSKKNNILHLAAYLAPIDRLHSVPGPAFQMQKEFEWFKAVENLVFKEETVAKNSRRKTPQELFYEEHKGLIQDAKEWIKDTSNSGMVVAALVATVAFASMITVPGGLDNGTGKPILVKNEVFIAFSVSNALSMISSAIALLMFLSLQTSRFTADDFLASLPKNLLRGLLALFFAVATMMIAFGTAIGIALQSRVRWGYIPITVAACFPTIIFIRLQLPLLFQTLGIEKYSKGLLS